MSVPTGGYTIAGAASATTAPLTVQNTQADRSADYIPMYSSAAVGTVAINISNLLGISSQVMALSDAQSVSNKAFDGTNTYTAKDTSFTLQNASATTKRAQFLLSSITTGQTRIFTLPDYNGTIATQGGVETFTNKTLTAPTITNATITADVYSGYTGANTGIIYGINVTSGAFSSAISMTSTLSVTGQPTFQGSTAPVSGGANTSGIKMSSTANFGLFWGTGAPTFSAAQGSVYLRTDGSSTSTRLYVNTNGSTGWTNFTSAA